MQSSQSLFEELACVALQGYVNFDLAWVHLDDHAVFATRRREDYSTTSGAIIGSPESLVLALIGCGSEACLVGESRSVDPTVWTLLHFQEVRQSRHLTSICTRISRLTISLVRCPSEPSAQILFRHVEIGGGFCRVRCPSASSTGRAGPLSGPAGRSSPTGYVSAGQA